MYVKYFQLLLCGILLLSCSFGIRSKDSNSNNPTKTRTKFSGNYNKTFDDLPDLHLAAATENGVGPLESRADTAMYMDKLVRIPEELELYKVDKLKHSMPFLVPKASKLLSEICFNFRDSLIKRKLPIYKPIITSITRTDDDVKSLARRNRNASDSSVHRFATTFDIAWSRFEKVNQLDERALDDGKLKAILGMVLYDLREEEKCYVKHERKQACFHITVR